jgi:hypothetical protein
MERFMKLRTMTRWQLALAGLAAAMFFAPPAYSQEISNTAFDDGPYVAGFDSSTTAQSAAQTDPGQAPVPPVNQVAAIETTLAAQPAASLDSPLLTAGLTVLLLMLIAIAAIREPKRANRGDLSGSRYAPRGA